MSVGRGPSKTRPSFLFSRSVEAHDAWSLPFVDLMNIHNDQKRRLRSRVSVPCTKKQHIIPDGSRSNSIEIMTCDATLLFSRCIQQQSNVTSTADSSDHGPTCDYLLTLCTSTFSALFRALHVCLILSHTLGFNWLHLAWLRCAWPASLILSFPSFHPSWLPSTFFPSAWLWLGSARLGFTLLSLARLHSASFGLASLCSAWLGSAWRLVFGKLSSPLPT